ncbi:uncharacterized protein LOC144914923 [Branchiostoma floridae x Branchiostoma belcheri]
MIREAEGPANIDKHIVYLGRKQKLMDVWGLLVSSCKPTTKGSVRAFHADMSPKAKEDVLQGFREGRIRVIVASVAFGMGIDVPDVKGVVVYGMPSTTGQLYQQIGRAGRKGDPAHAVLFFNKPDWCTDGPMKDLFKADCLRQKLLHQLGQEGHENQDQCCSVHSDDDSCIFTQVTEGPERNAKRRKPRLKRRQDTNNEEELKSQLYSLRDQWYELRPELVFIGPCGIMFDDTLNRIAKDCHSIHMCEDLKLVKGITNMPINNLETIIATIDRLIPEQNTKKNRRPVLRDVTNLNQ